MDPEVEKPENGEMEQLFVSELENKETGKQAPGTERPLSGFQFRSWETEKRVNRIPKQRNQKTDRFRSCEKQKWENRIPKQRYWKVETRTGF